MYRYLFIVLMLVVNTAACAATPVTGKFTAEGGKTLLFMGQDTETISEYKKAVPEHVYDGVTLYTNIISNDLNTSLKGVHGPDDNGGGLMDFPLTLKENPDAMLAIGLFISDDPECQSTHLKNIARGKYDDVIAHFAGYLRGLAPRPVLLRIGYEFDGPWNCHRIKPYKNAYRYMVEKLRSHAVDNVAYVWHSAAWPDPASAGDRAADFDHSRDDHLRRWYPGDDVVDWVGVSVFHRDKARWTFKPPHDLKEVQAKILDFARQHNKPVFIAEAAPQGFRIGGLTVSTIHGNHPAPVTAEQIWNDWFKLFFDFIDRNRDVIRAVSYINAHWEEHSMWHCKLGADGGPPDCGNGNWGDSRVQANGLIKREWLKELMNKDKWH